MGGLGYFVESRPDELRLDEPVDEARFGKRYRSTITHIARWTPRSLSPSEGGPEASAIAPSSTAW
jgi:hypothetical protein